MKKLYFLLGFIFCSALLSAQVVWSGGATCAGGSSTTWLTPTNWCGGVLPGTGQIAQFSASGTATLIAINMNGISVANKTVGAIEMTGTVNGPRTYQNSSTTVSGAIVLNGSTVNGVPNTILRNNSSFLMTITTAVTAMPFGISLGNTTENIIQVDGTAGITVNVVIKDSTLGAKKLVKAGTGSGVLTLAGANTYSGGTTITAGTLTCGAINTIPSTGTVTFNGGTLRTGVTAGFNQSAGTLALTNNSNIILGTGVHTLNFTNSAAVSWTAGRTLTITGWTGGYNGTSGTGTKIFAGSDATGLTAGQLAQIFFFDGTSNFPATILSTGEVVPAALGAPTINVTPSSLTGFVSLASPAFSAEQTYSVDGSDLTNNIVITPPAGFEISLTTGTGFISAPATLTLTQTGGVVAATNIYVRMNSATPGANTGNITHTSAGSNNPDVALSGNVIAAEPTIQSSITFGAITNTTMVVNFGGGNGAKRILLVKAILPVDSDPADATTYTASASYGAGSQLGTGNYVVYAGTGNTVTVTGLSIGTLYQYAVYEYNDGNVAGAENYLIPAGVNSSTTTSIPVVYTWIGGSSTWNTALNWLPARIFPAPNDILLFLDGTTETVTAVPAESIGQLHVTLGTHVTLQAAAATTTLTLNGSILSDDLTVDATSALNISSSNGYTINLATGTTAVIDGTMTFTGGAHRLTSADANGITFNSGSVFTAGTGFTGNAFGVSPAAIPNSVIFTSGSTYRQISGGNPFALTAPASAVIFQTGSLYRLESNLTPSVSGRTYANFELDAPASALNASGVSLLSIDNLTITNGSISFGLTTAGFNLKGNVAVAGGATLSFAPGSAGALRFNGTSPQSISNAGTLTFGANQNVEINNAAGLTLNTPVTLARVLTFTSGLINTSTPNLLTLTAAASVSGANGSSFVNGPVSKIGNTLFTFPVGKTNCGPSNNAKGYAPVSISAPAGATDQFTAEYVHSSGSALGPITAIGLQKVSACDYWKLDQVSGANTIDVTLNWADSVNNCTTASPYINNLASLVIAHFDGISWNSFGGLGTATGATTAGTLTWPMVNTFSPFTIGSVDFNNPLPITINYFTGTKNNGSHLLNWKVTCVTVPSATIEMERSSDGRNYNSIYSIFATALRCQQPFNYTDDQPVKGINYYRLKMTDADGKVTYSSVVPLINAVKGMDVMNIAPNPVVSSSFNLQVSSAEKAQLALVITDMQGRLVQQQTINIIAGFNSIPVNVKTLAAGTYQLFGNTAGERTRVLRFVIQ